MSDFPARLKIVRENTGLSQATFGAMGGVLQQAQYKYEKGTRKPDIEYLMSLAEHGIDVQYLITGSVSSHQLSNIDNELISLFKKADPTIQKAILKLLGYEPTSQENL